MSKSICPDVESEVERDRAFLSDINHGALSFGAETGAQTKRIKKRIAENTILLDALDA